MRQPEDSDFASFIRKLVRPNFCEPAMKPARPGFVLYWQLTQLGVKCDVVAPSLVPEEARGQGQDRPAGCVEAGSQSPLR